MFDTIVKILITFAVAGILIALLPVSPFQSFVSEIGALPYLGVVNWIFPVGQCFTVLMAWATAVAVFYCIAWILRQLDIIGS